MSFFFGSFLFFSFSIESLSLKSPKEKEEEGKDEEEAFFQEMEPERGKKLLMAAWKRGRKRFHFEKKEEEGGGGKRRIFVSFTAAETNEPLSRGLEIEGEKGGK